MTLNWISLLHLLGLAQAMFLVLVLLHPHRRSRANLILAALMLTLGAGLWEAFAQSSDIWKTLPLMTGWFSATPFLFGPLLLAYVRRLIGDQDWSATAWALHLAPTIVFTLALLPILVEPADQRVERLLAAHQGLTALHPINWVVLFLKCGHIAAYLLITLRRLISFRVEWKRSQSDTDVVRLRWLQRLCLAFVVLQTVWLVLVVAAAQGLLPGGTTFDDLALLGVAVLVFLIGYWGLSAPVLEQALASIGRNRTPDARYQTSALGPDAGAELAQHIEASLRIQQLYLQPRLRLAQLAEAVDATPHMTSQAINEHLGGNFFDLVNRYRVEEAARRLRDPALAHLPIERIAYDCGFNNRTSFSRTFRAVLGTTPSKLRISARSD